MVFPMHRLADETLNCRVELNGMGNHCKMVEIPVAASEVMVFWMVHVNRAFDLHNQDLLVD